MTCQCWLGVCPIPQPLSHRRGRFCVRVGGGIGRYGKREPSLCDWRLS
jgi:hypothetical protein